MKTEDIKVGSLWQDDDKRLKHTRVVKVIRGNLDKAWVDNRDDPRLRDGQPISGTKVIIEDIKTGRQSQAGVGSFHNKPASKGFSPHKP